jgi:4-aminobutyrate aminotransferase/(S)-3-amino-2-methylpropionate transaminase
VATLKGASLQGVSEIRHAGMMLGLQVETELGALSATRALLERGYLVLPAGERADVIQLVPPVTLSQARFDEFVEALDEVLGTPS